MTTTATFLTRPALAGDRASVLGVAVSSALFSDDEVPAFAEVVDGPSGPGGDGSAVWLVADAGDEVVGAAYAGAEAFADRVWNLFFLAVAPAWQGHSVGSALVGAVEADLRARGEAVARVLVVETSSTEGFEVARSFYVARGFVEEARIREFYGPGDDKVVFWKRLVGGSSAAGADGST